MVRIIVLCAVALGCFASETRAQSEAAVALGLSVTSNDPTGQLGISAASINLLYRLNMGSGVGPSIGFGWHSNGLCTIAGSKLVYVGTFRARPVMAGVSYTWIRGKWSVDGSLVAGYSFNTVRVDDRARPVLRSALGADLVSFGASNSFVWRPQVGVWYDVAPRVGLRVALGYVAMNSTLTTTADNVSRTTRIDAACTVLSFGVAYGIF